MGLEKSDGARRSLTPRQMAFVEQYLIDLNATQAAIRAGYSARTATQIAAENLSKPNVSAAIAAAMAARSERVKVDQDTVLKLLVEIATADVRQLTEYHRTCCRYCWGKGNRYQRTAGEMERDREEHAERVEKAKPAVRARLGEFDEKGGVGYRAKRDPNPECDECFGDGVGSVVVHDTRRLSPAAARLFSGVKESKDGLEVLLRDQDAALMAVARHLGMFKDKLELSGRVEGAVQYIAQIPERGGNVSLFTELPAPMADRLTRHLERKPS